MRKRKPDVDAVRWICSPLPWRFSGQRLAAMAMTQSLLQELQPFEVYDLRSAIQTHPWKWFDDHDAAQTDTLITTLGTEAVADITVELPRKSLGCHPSGVLHITAPPNVYVLADACPVALRDAKPLEISSDKVVFPRAGGRYLQCSPHCMKGVYLELGFLQCCAYNVGFAEPNCVGCLQ